MKYLRVFENDAEYQAFKGGGAYIEPHIVGVKNGNNIPVLKFKEKEKKIITFYVNTDNNLFQCEEGITWFDFIEKGLNNSFYIYDNMVYYSPITYLMYSDGNRVYSHDKIIENYIYESLLSTNPT